MLIALLVVLGVNLIVIVAFVAVVVGRRRWLRKQPGHFVGAVRVTSGQLDGIPTKWKRGSARWIRDVLVWSKAPFMFRTQLVAVDRIAEELHGAEGEPKHLGNDPVAVTFAAGDATIDVAARAEHRDLLTGPFTTPAIQ